MNGLIEMSGTGAVDAASGPENANAVSPASPDTLEQADTPPHSSLLKHEPLDGGDRASIAEKYLLDGADLLDRVSAFIGRFVSLRSVAERRAMTLWVAHTHLINAWQSTPRLAFLSPEPGSGKSRAMEIAAVLSVNSVHTAGSTAAFFQRAVGYPQGKPTFFIDEIDAVFGEKAGGNESLRSFINSGYRRGVPTGKCGGSNGSFEPELLESYAAIAMAGLGNLPDTILTRSVIIKLQKRAPHEKIEPYRLRTNEPQGRSICDELALWAASVFEKAAALIPDLPDEITDRNADLWEPLIAVGDLAGGPWSDWAREAALEFITAGRKEVQPSLGVQLLGDIRTCFGSEDQVPTAKLLNDLIAMDEQPWGNLQGRKLDARALAKMLREYDIRSTGIRLPDGTTPKGYKRTAFHDAWARYLPPLPPGATSATSATGGRTP